MSVETSGLNTNKCDGELAKNSAKRWLKIKTDYKQEDGFDISKIPEICDNIKFDNLHNPERINPERLELMEIAQMMCRVIVPFEYGLTT